jgi:Ca2+-binding RTX toxin-like protein
MILVFTLTPACSGVADPGSAVVEGAERTAREALAAPYSAEVVDRTLTITGTSADSSLTLRVGALPTTLDLDVGSDGTTDFEFDRSTFENITVDAKGGNDVIVLDEASAPFTTEEAVTLHGGSGDDTLIGGRGAVTMFGEGGDDTIRSGDGDDIVSGGAGNDTIQGGRGQDSIDLGSGNDTVQWNPGDGSDVIAGGNGTDKLVFNGANANETIEIAANGSGARLTRDVGLITLDFSDIERIDLCTRGGTDTVRLQALGSTGLDTVNVDLAEVSGSGNGDGLADAVVLAGVASTDTVRFTATAGAVTTTALGAAISVVGGDVATDRVVVPSGSVELQGTDGPDQMNITSDGTNVLCDGGGYNVLVSVAPSTPVTVFGRGGDDQITSNEAVLAGLTLDGGDGNDTIVGGAGADRILGGPGNDVVTGGRGADVVTLGGGDDVYRWNPGDGSDVLDGGAGTDSLEFNASAASETIDVSPNGGRVLLARNIGQSTTDFDGIEQLALRMLGGADVVNLGDLSGTALSNVSADLSSFDGVTPDGQLDTVVVRGTQRRDTIAVSNDNGDALVSGLHTTVRVSHADPTDQLQIHGGGGNDAFSVDPSLAGVISVSAFED